MDIKVEQDEESVSKVPQEESSSAVSRDEDGRLNFLANCAMCQPHISSILVMISDQGLINHASAAILNI